MNIPKKETDEIVAALTKQYARSISGETFLVSGRFEPGFLHMEVELHRRDDSSGYLMQFRCALAENKIGQAEALDVTVDFVGWYLDQYFESSRELLLPLDFQPYNMGEKVVFACGDIDNPRLTKMADEILERGIPCE